MAAFAGVGVLVEVTAVESRQCEVVGREMGGDPVEDDPDAVLMEVVDEVAEVVGGP